MPVISAFAVTIKPLLTINGFKLFIFYTIILINLIVHVPDNGLANKFIFVPTLFADNMTGTLPIALTSVL